MTEWIDIKDNLPAPHTYVLCYVKSKIGYSYNSYNNIKIKWVTKNLINGKINDKSWFKEVTHWMPLPKKPE